jgi:uncharacterized membrane protein
MAYSDKYKMLDFIVLAYTVGPMPTITYGLHVLSMDPIEIFFYLCALNILPIPILFWVFEHGKRYRELYRMKIFRKIAAVTDETMEEIIAKGDKITGMFEEKLGHLGFYLSIVVFTFIFGVLWAAVLSYILAVNRRMAVVCISAGVIVGNIFWLFLIEYFRDYVTPAGMIAVAISFPLLLYGSRRERSVIREVAAKFSDRLKKISNS